MLGLLGPAACDRGPRPAPPEARAPLYRRLGEAAVLRVLVDELAARLAADPALTQAYAATDFRAYKKRLVVELCGATGGPCRMRPPGPLAPDLEASAWLGHLAAAAAAIEVPAELRAELVRRVMPRAGQLARAE